MKRAINTTVSFFRSYKILSFSGHSKVKLILTVLLIVGMIVGTSSVSSIDVDFINNLNFIFLTDFNERIQQSNLQIFISSFSILSFFSLIIELSAFSCWGIIFIPLIMSFKGLGLGITAGYLYLIYGLKGIAFYILILLPGIFISSVGLISLSAEAINFSSKLLNHISPKLHEEKLWDSLKYHLKKTSYCLTILCVSSLLDVLFMMMFSRFFHF